MKIVIYLTLTDKDGVAWEARKTFETPFSAVEWLQDQTDEEVS